MACTLVVAQLASGGVDEVTAELVTAAASMDAPVVLGVVASDPTLVNPTLVKGLNLSGVDRVVIVQRPDGWPAHEVQQRAVEALIDATGPRAVLMSFSWESAAFAAAIAEQRNLAFVSDVVELTCGAEGTLVAVRPVYGGKARASLALPADVPAILLLRPGSWPADSPDGQSVATQSAESSVSDASRVRLVRVIEGEADDADLTQAEVIFALGRGVGKQESVAIFADVARKLGVSLGASRPLVDIGLLPKSRQIGQSGVTVKPKLYVAFGISGSPQHLMGMSGSRVIFAINTDAEAPIFDAAQLGSCVDAMEVARCLLADA